MDLEVGRWNVQSCLFALIHYGSYMYSVESKTLRKEKEKIKVRGGMALHISKLVNSRKNK